MSEVIRINHVAIVVDRIEAALGFWRDGLGLEVTHVEDVPSQEAVVAFMPTGDSEVELVKPTSEESGVGRFLQNRGPGIHHICLEVIDIERCLNRLAKNGVRLINPEPVLGTGGKRIAFVIGHGVLQQRYGVHTIGAIVNLSLMTGSLGTEGAGIYVLARENNQTGAMDMGTDPNLLPGRMPLSNDAQREIWEKNWQVKISPDPGLNMSRVIEAAESGQLKALYIMGENPLRSLPQPDRVKAAIEKLEFVVVQDILNNEIVKLADVALPGAAVSEKNGSFTNLEGRIQNFSPAVQPPGEAKPD